MSQWSTNQVYNIGDIVQITTSCGNVKHYVAVIKHISSVSPSGLKSDLEKYWKETTVSNEEPVAVEVQQPAECLDNEELAEKTLTVTIGIFIGLIVSKIIS